MQHLTIDFIRKQHEQQSKKLLLNIIHPLVPQLAQGLTEWLLF